MNRPGGGSRGPTVALLVTLACLVPFLGKAFHVDDPLFLWAARQIQEHPLDFYGFSANWSGVAEPMADVAKNPPGSAYYLALAAFLLGWSERSLHLAFLVPALLAALGTWVLARRLTSMPTLATLAAVLTPAFLVSATNLMSDVPMLALWVWALALWTEGMERGGGWRSAAAAVLVAACALTKYFGLALLPLLLLYTIARERGASRRLLFLVVPLAVWTGYHFLAASLYGRGLFTDAASYATDRSLSAGFSTAAVRAVEGLCFAGGSVVTALVFAPLLWSRKTIALAVLATLLAVGGLSWSGHLLPAAAGARGFAPLGQMSAFVLGGASLLGLALTDLRRERSAESLLLAAWVAGTFVFAAFVNWTVNVRSLLPIAPAAGILIARRLSSEGQAWRHSIPLALAAAISLAVAWADHSWAGSAREAAARVRENVGERPARTWFEGHWGFQYYMQANGYLPLDLQQPALRAGEIVVIPENNSGILPLRQGTADLMGRFEIAGPRFLATMSPALGAGFYADVWGPLPYALGRVPPESYFVFRVR